MKIFNKENFNKANLVRVGKAVLVVTVVTVGGVFVYGKLKERDEYYDNENKRLFKQFEDMIESKEEA